MKISLVDIENYYQEYESVRFDKPKRNYDDVKSDIEFLRPILDEWHTALETIIDGLGNFDDDTLLTRKITSELQKFYVSASNLLEKGKDVKSQITTMNVEPIRKDVEEGIFDTLHSVHSILDAFHKNVEYKTKEHIVQATIDSLTLDKTKITNIQRKVKSYRPSKVSTKSLLGRFTKWLFSSKMQFRLYILVVVGLIVTGIYDLGIEAYFDDIKVYSRIFSVSVGVLWLQATFMMSWTKRIQSIVIGVMFWATLNNVWIYGIVIGFIVSFLIYALPLIRLFGLFKGTDDKTIPDRFIRQLSVPYSLSWLVVLIITHEIIWLLGLIIWLTFNVFIRGTSYRFFRQTYDLIEDIYPDKSGRKQREFYFVLSSALTAFLLLTGILGYFAPQDVLSIFNFSSDFALILITILLAIQAIILGINIWSKDENPRHRIREMRLMLRANRGLGGFMSSFFFLFIISNIGRFFVQKFASDMNLIVSVDIIFMTTPIGNLFDVMASPSNYSVEHTMLVFVTILFVSCISLLIYSITQLYYMFSTASIFLLPIRDTLLATPIVIEKISNAMLTSNKEATETNVVDALTSNSKLNGYIIGQLNLINSTSDTEKIVISIQYDIDFPDKNEMYRILRETNKMFFDSELKPLRELPSIDCIGISFFRETYSMGRHNLFALQVNREQWEFLKKDTPNLSEQFKIEHVLGAKLIHYMLPEAQIF